MAIEFALGGARRRCILDPRDDSRCFSFGALPSPQAPSFWCLVAILAVLSGIVGAAPIYMSPTQVGDVWDGRCSNWGCTLTSPCYLVNSVAFQGSGPCTLIFQNGTYDGILHVVESGIAQVSSLEIVFSPGLISNLQLEITTSAPTRVNGTGSLLYKTYLKLSTGNTRTTVDNLKIYGSTVNFISGSSVNLTRCAERNSMISFSTLDIVTYEHLESLNSTRPFPSKIVYMDSYIEGVYTLPTIPPDNSGSFPPRGASTNNKRDAPNLNSSFSPLSSVERSVSNINWFPPGNFMSSVRSTWNQTSISPTGGRFLHFESSTLIDTSVTATSGANFTNTTITQYLPNNAITVSLPITMQDSNFSNPNHHDSSYLATSGSGTFSFPPSSNAVISDLRLTNGATLSLGDVEITHSIRAPNPSPFAIVQPANSTTTWRLHSIDIFNVFVNYTDLHCLIYIPSNASKGISVIGVNVPLSPLPQRTSIDWDSNLAPPTYLEVYPVTNFSRDGLERFFPLSAPFSPYALAASFAGPNSTLMTFQSFDDPQSPSTCSNPPPGFTCSPSGHLFAPSTVDQPSVTIPGESGNVLVMGDLIVDSEMTLTGTGTTLTVMGCANIGNGITLDVDPEKAPPKGSVTLMTQSEDCGGLGLNKIPLKVKSSKGSCKQVSVRTDPASSPSHLSAILIVDSSRCNVKWIIIGAVLGAVLVIAVIVTFFLGSYLHTRSQRKRAKMT